MCVVKDIMNDLGLKIKLLHLYSIELGRLTYLFLGTPSQALLAVTVVRMSQFVRDKTLICKSSGVA